MDQGSSRPGADPQPVDADHEPGGLALAFMLLALAGWVDGLGLVQWHGLFVSFMSGNSTALGASPALGDWQGASEAGRAVLLFVAGTVTGELLGAAAGSRRDPVVIGTEAALLWLALASNLAGWGGDAVTASITGLAMGIQTAALHKVGGKSVALTYVTGTLVSLGRGLAAALRGEARWREASPYAGCWLALVSGAVGGGFVARLATPDALVVAASVASATAILTGLGIVTGRPSLDP